MTGLFEENSNFLYLKDVDRVELDIKVVCLVLWRGEYV